MDRSQLTRNIVIGMLAGLVVGSIFHWTGESVLSNYLVNGFFDFGGKVPVNTHGGLMSFGHSGVAGGMAHLVEVYRQMANKAGERQIPDREVGLIHGEGGILSSQISLALLRG